LSKESVVFSAFSQSFAADSGDSIHQQLTMDRNLKWFSSNSSTTTPAAIARWRGNSAKSRFLVREVQSDTQRLVQHHKLIRGWSADEVGQDRFWQADEFIAMNAAVVLQTLLNAGRDLGRQAVESRIDRRTSNC
jgi:hypothetical protein